MIFDILRWKINMKKISVVIPTYNEKENINDGYERVKDILKSIKNYDYEILYIDNCSDDGTRDLLKILASKDKKVKVILNAVNVGWSRSSFYGLINSTGDAAVLLAADMQEPPELIPRFLEEYEKGNKIIIGIKTKSKENYFKYFIRQIYYKLLKKIAVIDHIEQFMGFGLYDRSFLDLLKDIDDPLPYLRGMVPELGGKRIEIEYTQETRKKGKTHFNFWGMYDLAMLGITSYSKRLLQLCTVSGAVICSISLVIALVTFILKVFNVVNYPIGIAAISIGIFFFGSLNLFFVGLIGEYIVNINTRIMHRPLVIEEERINF